MESYHRGVFELAVLDNTSLNMNVVLFEHTSTCIYNVTKIKVVKLQRAFIENVVELKVDLNVFSYVVTCLSTAMTTAYI